MMARRLACGQLTVAYANNSSAVANATAISMPSSLTFAAFGRAIIQ
jgi:hypothetical protein